MKNRNWENVLTLGFDVTIINLYGDGPDLFAEKSLSSSAEGFPVNRDARWLPADVTGSKISLKCRPPVFLFSCPKKVQRDT